MKMMLVRIGPDEERQAEPSHAGARMVCTVTMKFKPVRMEEKPLMKTPRTAE